MRCASSSKAPINRHRRLSVALAAITGAVAIAACGSSSKATSTPTSGAFPQGIKYADCMRFQGVPNFPDPNANGSVNVPSDINPDAPAFQSAQQECASLQPNANGPRPAITAAQQKSFVTNALCTRKHGVPNFPDPVFAPGGQGIGYNVTPGSLAYETQGILQASRACRNVGSPLPLRALTQGAP
jgi:hypothetical protein